MNFDSFVLAAATADLADEPVAREQADAVEFRMDLAADPAGQLDSYDGALPIVATNRAAWEGGDASDDERRLEELAAAAERDAVGAIDVELESLRTGDGARVADRARDCGTAVIASAHDFERTPPVDELRVTLRDAVERADVGKLATTASDPGDVLALLSVTRELSAAGETVATMAMGAAGRHSRAIAPIYGSKIGYAPVDPANATAPGQYDLASLAELIERLS